MLSKKVIAVAQDAKFQKRLAAGLMAAGGAVETVASVAELTAAKLEADLVVYVTEKGDTEMGTLLGKLRPDTPIIVIVPSSDLGPMVDLMKDERISNIMVADDMDAARLSAVATKLLFGDVFGLEKFLPWGVRIYSMLVGDYQEKSVAIAAISDFAAAMGVRRKYRESIEQSIDELLMNALYDAPVDQSGKQVFADVPTKTRISLRMEQKAVIQYACDGERFAVSVRDSFGMLTKDIVLKFVEKCIRSSQQIDRKAGGAGLGLYLVANSSSEFHINLYPGVATEAIVVFDLTAPKVQLKNFGVYKEKIDVAGRLATAGAAKRMSGGGAAAAAPASGGLRAALAAAVMLLLASLGVVAWQQFQKPGKGALLVTTEPAGGVVFIDHARRGPAPIRIDDVSEGTYAVTVELAGYQQWEAPVRVTAGKEPTALTVSLKRQKGTIVVQSTPAGAKVLVDGEDSGKITPATLTDLSSGERHKLTVRATGFRDHTQDVTVPEAGQSVSMQVPLQLAPGYGSVSVESEPAGAIILFNGVEQQSAADGYVLKSGSYELTARLPGYIAYSGRVVVQSGGRQHVKAKLLSGGTVTIRSNVEAKVTVDNHNVGKTPLSSLGLGEGMHTVLLRAAQPHLFHEFKVAVKKGEQVEKDFRFGRVEVRADNVVARPAGSDARGVTELAVLPGTQQIPLLNKSTGEERNEKVSVGPGETVVIDKW